MPAYHLPSINKIAEALGGDVANGEALVPGPGHSAEDRSLSIKLDSAAPDGFVVYSFAGDDPIACRDHVRRKLGLPEFEPKKKASGSSSKNKKGNGVAKPWSPIIARYVYRLADGTPYLQVCRTAAKQFFQNKWNGQMWVTGKPDGPKIPYRLPELRAAPLTAQVHIAEGEQDGDALTKLGFVATTNSEGAGTWTGDLNEYFRDRHVCIHEDNDEQGRKRVQRIARALHSIAASVRVIRLPGLKKHGDISDWLESDPSGARLVKECESTPIWEPSTTPPPEDEKEKTDPPDGTKKKQADVLIELASSVELFHDRDDVGYARFDVNGHKENWPIRSKGFKRWLARGFYESTQSAPSSEAMQAALGVLEARAQFDAPEHEVHVRVAGHDDCIYIDLADRN
jgi:5S rRNA maturation endonuclease (ribonuclease M5)